MARVMALLALAALPASPATAAQALHLTWNECALAPSASHDFASTCAGETGTQSLFCAFELAQPVDSVIAIEVTIDLQHVTTPLPNWWRFDPNGCRRGVLSANADFTGRTACTDFWGGNATKDPPVIYLPGEPGGIASRARIFTSITVPPDQLLRLEAGPTYYAAEFVIRNTGTSGCTGCGQEACLVLNSILIGRLPGAPGGNLELATPGATDAWATWQGGGAASCAAVPVMRSTWGRIKSLYR